MEDKKTIKKRKLKIRYKILILFILFLSTLCLWSRYISTSGLIVKEYKVINANLPQHYRGLKIVHFTDVHYGRTVQEKELNNLVNEINILNPDIVVFTGDIIDRDIKLTTTMESIIIKYLSKINAKYGKYAVKGNHDYSSTVFEKIIEDSGFINLNNDYDTIFNKYYEEIFIGGLDSGIKGHPDFTKMNNYFSTDGKDKAMYKLLIMHTPDTFSTLDESMFDLVLAGHSHNGQIRVPFFGAIITPPGAKQYYEPYYKINNTDLYISGGVGTSNISFRLFDKPSINLYRLVKK